MKLAALGEVMVELAPQGMSATEQLLYVQSCAGDTYNTAIYASRHGLEVSYVTLLGDDPYSAQMLAAMEAEDIDTAAIERLPGRCPGLYAIQNSADGERYFTYWRGESPARELFLDEGHRARLVRYLRQMHCLYLSGITLAIMSPTAREHLLAFIREFRRDGGLFAFDSNFRPRLWHSSSTAQETVQAFLQQTDIALLTLEDEQLLWGDQDATSCLERNAKYGQGELVLKRGSEPVLLQYEDKLRALPVPAVENIVDTTGAGDSFNAGYLAVRLEGGEPEQAVSAANRCARQVICHRGAIIPARQYQV